MEAREAGETRPSQFSVTAANVQDRAGEGDAGITVCWQQRQMEWQRDVGGAIGDKVQELGGKIESVVKRHQDDPALTPAQKKLLQRLGKEEARAVALLQGASKNLGARLAELTKQVGAAVTSMKGKLGETTPQSSTRRRRAAAAAAVKDGKKVVILETTAEGAVAAVQTEMKETAAQVERVSEVLNGAVILLGDIGKAKAALQADVAKYEGLVLSKPILKPVLERLREELRELEKLEEKVAGYAEASVAALTKGSLDGADCFLRDIVSSCKSSVEIGEKALGLLATQEGERTSGVAARVLGTDTPAAEVEAAPLREIPKTYLWVGEGAKANRTQLEREMEEVSPSVFKAMEVLNGRYQQLTAGVGLDEGQRRALHQECAALADAIEAAMTSTEPLSSKDIEWVCDCLEGLAMNPGAARQYSEGVALLGKALQGNVSGLEAWYKSIGGTEADV